MHAYIYILTHTLSPYYTHTHIHLHCKCVKLYKTCNKVTKLKDIFSEGVPPLIANEKNYIFLVFKKNYQVDFCQKT